MKKQLVSICALFVALFIALASSSALAADTEQVPVHITADSMRYAPSGNEVVFQGGVHVARPDFEIWAARIIIHLSPGKKKADPSAGIDNLDPGAIDKIVASGGVKLAHKGKVGNCQTATYEVTDSVFTMEGNPTLEDGKNKIQGHVIKFYVKDNRSEVIGGGNQRVNATFYAPQKVKPDGKTDKKPEGAQ